MTSRPRKVNKMNKLICVECMPQAGILGRKQAITPLTGLIGETLERYLHSDSKETQIPVRFPLAGPGSYVSLLRSDRDPTDPYTLAAEGEYVDKSGLYVLKDRVPVSLYTRVPICDTLDLFEKPVYFSTYSLSKFFSLTSSLRGAYQWEWVWKLEKLATNKGTDDKFKHIFIEARFYGIDSVITTYDSNRFRGVAVEIIYRPQATPEMIEKGIRVMRTCSDLYLFSNTDEYLSYIDGVSVSRERAEGPHTIKSRYANFITPKQASSLNRFKDHYAKVVEERNRVLDTKKEAKEEKFKGDVPPPHKDNKERYSFAGVAAQVTGGTAKSVEPATGNYFTSTMGTTGKFMYKTNGGS